MALYRPKVAAPPSDVTGALRHYLQTLADAINNTPKMSWFSGTSPNSVMTGTPGDMVINVGSASTNTRLWIMGGTTSNATQLGWVVVRTLA